MAFVPASPEDEARPAEPAEVAAAAPKWRGVRFGLSARLLWLTIAFVMLAEVLIFLPSVANFRKNWLMERLAAAQIASLAAQAAPNDAVPERLAQQLLQKAMVHSLAVRRGPVRVLVLQTAVPGMVQAHYDLEEANWLTLIGDALYAFISERDRLIHVIGHPDLSDDTVEIVMTETPLKTAIYNYALNILFLSIAISLFSATLVYLTLNWFLVRPVSRLTWNIVRFRENPEDATRVIQPSGRSDEIGVAQEELAAMQNELIAMLRQKSRLAALGLAVSKINHDLRNMLASAQLISDRLSTSTDPTVQKFAPKLISSLDRAIALAGETLTYGRADEAPPQRHRFLLRPLIDEVGESFGLPGDSRIKWVTDVGPALEIDADRNQLYRILTNLVRNAMQVLESAADLPKPVITVAARQDGDNLLISVADNGPGVPPRARANLFQAFQGSVRVGGTGLGLAISAELARAHGGSLWLDDSAPGATFCLKFPNPERPLSDSAAQNGNHGRGILAFSRSKH
ncbi:MULTISPECIES: HAMP domain-containing sensor histidine kinase [Rhodomicrobium]|uniref:sensor histidine kinase n=1 Tax=Rhodomicrobium TaxID=1068 RepID=UPI000B4A86DB|nr:MULTISPECIES: HAMP domain-containing sensor histidine kinase [Rhodomicrobium]